MKQRFDKNTEEKRLKPGDEVLALLPIPSSQIFSSLYCREEGQ